VNVLYQIAYRLGLKPWDTGVSPPELIDVVEGHHALAPGRALDLGKMRMSAIVLSPCVPANRGFLGNCHHDLPAVHVVLVT
jgi:hypothetical protein